MGWMIPPVGRGLVILAALLVPLALALALLPTMLVWPFLSGRRQQRLHKLLEMVLSWTVEITTRYPAASTRAAADSGRRASRP